MTAIAATPTVARGCGPTTTALTESSKSAGSGIQHVQLERLVAGPILPYTEQKSGVDDLSSLPAEWSSRKGLRVQARPQHAYRNFEPQKFSAEQHEREFASAKSECSLLAQIALT